MAGIVDVMRDASGALDYAIDALEAPAGSHMRQVCRELKAARGVVADMLAALEAVLPDLWDGIELATEQSVNEAWLEGALHRLDAARAAVNKAKEAA